MDDAVKKALRLALVGTQRTAKSVSLAIGRRGDYISKRLAADKRHSKEFLFEVLGEVGLGKADFFDFLEGGLGDPRLHLAKILKTGAGPALARPRVQIPNERPHYEVGDLDGLWCSPFGKKRKFKSLLAWFADRGSIEERSEGWSLMGVLARREGALKRAAYCHLQALNAGATGTVYEGRILTRVVYLLQSAAMVVAAEQCATKAVSLFACHGDVEWLGRAAVDLARCYWSVGKYPESLQTHGLACMTTTNRAHLAAAHIGCGRVLLKMGRYHEAVKELDKGSSYAAEGEIFYIHLGKAYCFLHQEEFGSALEEMDKARGIAEGSFVPPLDSMELRLMKIGLLQSVDRGKIQDEIGLLRAEARLVSREFADAFAVELMAILRRKNTFNVALLVSQMRGKAAEFTKNSTA